MKTELLFKNLFARALKDWPEEITFGKLIHYDSPGFIIEGLGDLARKIENIYINQDDEVVMADLHYRIYWGLKKLAEFSLKVKMQDLRADPIQKEFESHIKDGLDDPERLNWRPEDVQLVQDYFAVNYPSSDITPEKIT